jgi:uncharacterized protein (DUF2345 family)
MAYSDADRTLTVRGTITYPDTATQAITSANISTFTINEDAGQNIPVGAAPASSILLTLDNSSGQWEPGGSILGAHILDGAKIELEIGLWNGASYDYSDIGTYYIDDVQGQEHEALITLKGSDAMASLMSEYYADSSGDYPQTLGSLLTDIASTAGVTLESSTFTNSTVSIPSQPVWRNDLTCRDVVGYIAACAGGIALFNRAGKLEIVTLETTSSMSIDTSVYMTLTRGDTFFGGLNAINVYPYGAPDGTSPTRYATTPGTTDTALNSINIKGNPILAYGSSALTSLGAGMLAALTGLYFRGATIKWHGDPSMCLGDLCTVTDLASASVPVLITKQTISFGPGFGMESGGEVTTSTKASAKLQKIFTPTGNLNAEALAGNIYVKAGEIMTLESGGIMNILSGGELNISSGGKLTLSSGDDIDVGDDTLADLISALGLKTTVFYQASQPTATATGDIWYDTDANPIAIKRWSGSAWVDITTTALSQALTAAGDAQATADGKIITFAQDSQPTASATGDLWVDTNDSNKLYRWSGSTWTLYKVASGYVSTSYITIDNDSIDIVASGVINMETGTNLNIKSGADIKIESGGDLNIASGGNVTVDSGGYLNLSAASGIRIGTQPLTVGGTNLLTNSDLSSDSLTYWTHWTSNSSSSLAVLTPTPFGYGAVHYTYTPGESVTAFLWQTSITGYAFNEGDTYTISFYAASTHTFSQVSLLHNSTYATIVNFGSCAPKYTREDGWSYYESTGIVVDSCTVANLLWNMPSAEHTFICRVMLQKGNIATDWSPAPEDTTNAIAAAVSGRTTIFYQTSQPTATETGDLWYDTDASPVTIKRWSGSAWVDITTTALSQALSDAADAQSTADGKIMVWAQTSSPTATATGDLWIDTDDNNKIYRWSGSAWTLYKVASGYVSTTSITIDNDSIDIVSAGAINMETGTNLNVKSGADIEVESGGDINVASGGKINITTSDDLMIGAQSIGAYADDKITLAVGNAKRKNAVKNGAFLAEILNWYAPSPWTRNKGAGTDSLLNYTTDYIMYCDNATGSNKTMRQTDIRVKPSTAYTLSLRAYYTTQTIQINLWQYNSSGTSLGSTSFTPNVNNMGLWQTAFTTQATAVKCTLEIVCKNTGKAWVTQVQIEEGAFATGWSPHPDDPSSGVKTSHITIETDSIDIASGGSLTVTAPTTMAITAGATDATAIAIRNDTDYFLSAGDLTQADAPFWVKKNGSIKAISGTIGGFTIASGSLSAQASGKPLLKLDTANSEITIGGLKIDFSDTIGCEFISEHPVVVRTHESFVVMDDTDSVTYFYATNAYAWCNGNMSALTFTDRP